jgi:glycosyltransferase involved in cell wall biosynthesis
MKITIVMPSFSGGGAERIGVNLANYYSYRGHSVTVVVFHSSGPYFGQVSQDIQVIDLGLRARYAVFKLVSELSKNRPDIIISIMRGANILVGLASFFFKSFKPSILFSEQNTFESILSLPFIKRKAYIALMRFTYCRAHTIIANSLDTQSDLLTYKIVKPEHTQVIGNPVIPLDIKVLLEEEISHPWLLDPLLKVILNVGRLHKQKNQVLLINAFYEVSKIHRNARLIVLGEGDEQENLSNLIDNLSLGQCVDIIPFQKNPYPFYKLADIFVLSSDWEGFGNVIVEAMASEIPVISTDCHGGPCMILKRGQYGTLVPPGNIDKLARAIVEELKCPTNPLQIAEAKKRAMDFSVSTAAEAYLRAAVVS